MPLVQALLIFHLQRLPAKEATDFKSYGVNHEVTLADHFGTTDQVEVKTFKSEWEHFTFVAWDLKTECHMTITPQPGYTQTEWLLTKLCSISSFKVMFYGFVWNQHSNQFPWVARSFGRALHQYRRGHRFKSRTGLNFFQVLFSLLLKKCSLLRTSLSYSRLYPQVTYMIFIYSQSFIYHFTGLYGTNINSQLAC